MTKIQEEIFQACLNIILKSTLSYEERKEVILKLRSVVFFST